MMPKAQDFWIYYQLLVVLGTTMFALAAVYTAYKVRQILVALRDAARSLKVLKTAKLIEIQRQKAANQKRE